MYLESFPIELESSPIKKEGSLIELEISTIELVSSSIQLESSLILVIRFMADLLRKYRGSVVIMVGRGGASAR